MSTLKFYISIGLIVAAAAVCAGVYAKGRLDASHAADLKRVTDQLDTVKAQNEQLEAIQRKDQLQAMQDAEDKERLNALIDSQGELLANPTDGCFTADDVGRVRSLFTP